MGIDLGRLRMLALAGLPLLLAGCGSESRKSAEAPNPALQNEARIVESPSEPIRAEREPQREAPSIARATNPRLQGPRSQQEIDNAYRTPEIATRPVASTPYVPPPALPVEDGKVYADPSWEVPIAREWNHIVVHHSASVTGSAAIFDRAHRERGWDGLGYHFVIGNGSASGDGEVEVGFRWTRQMQGAHAGNNEYNQHGIGICLVGNFEHGSLPSAAQMYSLRRLVRYLQVKTGVPTAEVCGHRNVPGKSTECPGNMDLDAFRASLGSGAIGVPIQIVNNGTHGGGRSATPHLARSSGGANIP